MIDYDYWKQMAPPTNDELEDNQEQQDEKELAKEWNRDDDFN
jgi:hypothetical protein